MGDPHPLLDAIFAGDARRARDILRTHPEAAQARDTSGVSAYMHALYQGRVDIAEDIRLLRPELDLWEATAAGEKGRVIELLLRNPFLIDRYSVDGFTPLGLAAFFGHPGIVDLLVTSNAAINAPSRNPQRVRPLHSAAAHAIPEKALSIVRTLLTHGAEVNVAQEGGQTPLHRAAARGHREVVQLLLRYGAEKTMRSDDGRTALDMALEANHGGVISLLR